MVSIRKMMSLAVVCLFVTGALPMISGEPDAGPGAPVTSLGAPVAGPVPVDDPEQDLFVRLIVGYAEEVPERSMRVVADHGGGPVRVDPTLRFVVVSVPEEAAEPLQRLLPLIPGVTYAKVDGEIRHHHTPNDPLYSQQWGPPTIDIEPVWANTKGNHSIEVAVLDTGVDYTHPDLVNNVCRLGPDFYNDDDDPFDDHYHGTHVAGTVAAELDNGIGVAGMANVCVVPVKVLSAWGGGHWSDLASALVWSADNGVDIISMSLGGCCDPGEPVRSAIEHAAAAGVLIIASAGNSGCGDDRVGFPAAYPEVIAIASLASATQRSSFSSCGPAVELAAPGSDIISTMPGNDYAYLSGTSMAAPHVSGAAALFWAGHPHLNAAEVRCILAQNAVDLGSPGLNEETGFGRINVAAMFADPACLPRPPVATELAGMSGDGATVLGWKPAFAWGGVDGYVVYRNDTSGQMVEIANITATVFEDTDVAIGVTYTYAVAAYNTAGEGARSNTVQVTVREAHPLPYSEDFESGLGEWEATGLWGVTKDRQGSGKRSAYFGIESLPILWRNHYDTGRPEYGTLTSPPLLIPADTAVSMRFWQHADFETERWESHPIIEVASSVDPFDFQPVWGMNNWNVYQGPAAVDLSAFAGEVIYVRFVADSSSHWPAGEGWYVDDIEVVAEAAPALDPFVRLEHPYPNRYLGASTWVTGRYADPNGDQGIVQKEFRTGDGNWTEALYGWGSFFEGVLQGLESGRQVLSVRVTDSSGKMAHHDVAFLVDAEPPELTITSPAEGATVDRCIVQVTGTASDTGGSGLDHLYGFATPGGWWGHGLEVDHHEGWYWFNGEHEASWSLQVDAAYLDAGPIDLVVIVTDRAGNSAWSVLPLEREGGDCRPVLTVDQEDGAVLQGRATISGTVDWIGENTTGNLWIYVDGQIHATRFSIPDGAWSVPWNTWEVENGTYEVRVSGAGGHPYMSNQTIITVQVENDRTPILESATFEGVVGCSVGFGMVTAADRCGDGSRMHHPVTPGLTGVRLVMTWEPDTLGLDRLGLTLQVASQSWSVVSQSPGRLVLEADDVAMLAFDEAQARMEVRAAGDGLSPAAALFKEVHLDTVWAYWGAEWPPLDETP